ncbi:MAG: PLP-dependent aspartate aminotransferase family protein [bacterium]|nr:PLP-dependent aspartate aminotransferase family protein [bacterium]MDZ4286068.1 PLP-dependent aspartate aminotransferase family protein [Candidatus Sungbacteria bacterium]
MSEESPRGFSTRALHTQIPWLHPHTHVMPPFLTSTYAMDSLDAPGDQEFPFKYARIGTPNSELLEHTLASLEGGEAAAVMADGMRAISATFMAMLQPHVRGTIVSTTPLYSDTHKFLSEYLPAFGKEYKFLHDPQSGESDLEKIIYASPGQPPVEILFIETPANPTLTIWDIKGLFEIAYANDILVIVDSTFGTPYNQRPLELGADLVIHSLTKYICGNGTTLGGAVIGSSDLIKKIKDRVRTEGGHMHPMAAWLIQQGLQTFGLRMPRHNENALQVARFLNLKKNKSKIAKVHYPGLSSDAGYKVAKEQMLTPEGCTGFGGMVSFELANAKWVKFFCNYLARETFIELAVSLGSTTSTFTVPALQIHCALPEDQRHALGISDTLVRFSVGVEDIQDIRHALESALNCLP